MYFRAQLGPYLRRRRLLRSVGGKGLERERETVRPRESRYFAQFRKFHSQATGLQTDQNSGAHTDMLSRMILLAIPLLIC
jgi:hypothetical protein